MRSQQIGFSLIELLVVVSIILIVAAIAIPNLLRSRSAANEASAVASVRSINTSQVVYQFSFGQGFAASLAALSDGGVPANCVPPTPPAANSSCLLDSMLASGTKNGYKFTYAPATSGNSVSTYTVNADPIASAGSGQRHFFSDQTLAIRFNATIAATSADPLI
jgi:type IV pilus assembly protein PilA